MFSYDQRWASLRRGGSALSCQQQMQLVPAPAKAGAAFLPHSLEPRWARDLGIQAHASWWLWEGLGMVRSTETSSALLCRICALVVPKAVGMETMETKQPGQQAPWVSEQHSSRGCWASVLTLAGLLGSLPAASPIIPGHLFSTVISWGEND